MSEADLHTWQARYLEGAYANRTHPTVYLRESLPTLQLPVKRALDVACGAGRNALYLARQGFEVDAVDIAPEALRRGEASAREAGLRTIRWISHDFDEPLPDDLDDYGLVVIIRYLNLELVRSVAQRLRQGGYLLAEVHLQTEEQVAGPSSARFRAGADELRTAVISAGLQIEQYSEGMDVDPDGAPVALARVLAVRP